MLNTLEDAINKTCLIGLTYFDLKGDQLKQSLLTGTVKAVDAEMGITITLASATEADGADFIIPANLSCWFNAPKGEFHTSQEGVKVTNPDYLVTWDIHQSKEGIQEGEQQWWQWRPRTEPPVVGN
ncbi:hypothetical protein [Thalassotalea sp. PLHSN55]|uniref:hypothetical protein n=1 Tax=Thalassotalea sp. PLHSN55 TaxID=3435888 RepID=UPI003F86AC6B